MQAESIQNHSVDFELIDKVFQEKCKEQQQPLFVPFIDLTKAFDLVSRNSLFKYFPRLDVHLDSLNIIRSFHEEMKDTIVFDGSTSDPFDIRNGVKRSCVLTLTLFGIFVTVDPLLTELICIGMVAAS